MRAVRALIAARAKARLAYRGDLLASVSGALLVAGVGPLLVCTLASHVAQLDGLSGPELLFCWGFADTVAGLFYVIFAGLSTLNRRYILGGELDRTLVRPLDPYLQLLLDNLALEDLPTVALGLAIMGAAVAWGLPPVAPWRWLLLPPLLVSGLLTLGGVVTAVVSLGFFLHHRGTAAGLVLQLAAYGRYPVGVFGRPLRWLLTFALPLSFTGFYPAAFFLSQPRYGGLALASPLVGLLCFAAGYGAWRLGLQRYASSGS